MGTAPAESMASPYCDKKNYDCGEGTNAKSLNSNTASAPCGSSFVLTINNKNIHVVVVDACPHKDNVQWCPISPGETNDGGSYNHFDLWVGNISNKITKKLGLKNISDLTHLKPTIKFKPLDTTPPYIIKILQKYCCNTWWYGQGCPQICGSDFVYADCK